MENAFFDTWESIIRIVVTGVSVYGGLILMLRGSGNRTLSQLNAFDLVITVALGSVLATAILNKQVPLVNGLLALALLIALQMLVSYLSVRFLLVRRVVKTEPLLLFYRGEYLTKALKGHRITQDEVLQMMRSEGIGNLNEVDAVVLETNGRFSVIKRVDNRGQASVLANVEKPPS